MTAIAAPAARKSPWRWLSVLAFITVTAALLNAASAIEWRRALHLLTTTNPAWIAVATAANFAIILTCAAFWQSILPRGEPRIRFVRMVEIMSVSSSLMNTLPFGGGHASSVLLLIRRGGTSQRGALSLLALTQLGEGVSKLLLFLCVAALAPVPTWMRTAIVSAAFLIAGFILVMVVASHWARELAILRSLKDSAIALGWVSMTKVVQALGIYAVQLAFGIDLPVSATLLVLAAIVLGTMVPLAPGNLGTFEASAFVTYRFVGIAPEQALSLAIMQHVCFMVPAVGVGYVYLLTHTVTRSDIASP